MVSRVLAHWVHSFERWVHGTWVRALGTWYMHGFESTGTWFREYGYVASDVPGTGYRYIVSYYPVGKTGRRLGTAIIAHSMDSTTPSLEIVALSL